MARARSAFLGLVILANLLTGCVTIACDPDDPQLGKDCYECTRKVTLAVQQGNSHTESRVSPKERMKARTEECLRERGYMKQK